MLNVGAYAMYDIWDVLDVRDLRLFLWISETNKGRPGHPSIHSLFEPTIDSEESNILVCSGSKRATRSSDLRVEDRVNERN